jgi:DNA-binding response OmpR family regulator
MTLGEEIEHLRAEVSTLRQTLAQITSDEFRLPGESGRFTRTERQILCLLASKEGGVIRHEVMWDALYGLRSDDEVPDTNVTKVMVNHIRRKLKKHRIECDWGVGYRLVPEAA